MLRLITAMAVALLHGASGSASAQADADFQIIRDWDADNSRTESTGETLRLESGTIWSPRAYDDFVLRFEYRPLSPTGRSTLRLRATVLPDSHVRSYDVALDRGAGRGRLDGARQVLHELRFVPSPAREDASAWIAVEARAEQDRLTISLDGVTVATADRAEAFFGTIGFEAVKGGLELRGMRVATLKVPSSLNPSLPRAGDPGVTTPRALRDAYPSYTRAAMKARAQGVAKLEFVIEADGTPGAGPGIAASRSGPGVDRLPPEVAVLSPVAARRADRDRRHDGSELQAEMTGADRRGQARRQAAGCYTRPVSDAASLPAVATVRPDTCPVCGGPNGCGLAAGASTCWCFTASIPAAALERVPEAARDRSCLCAACAGQTAAAPRSAVGP